jgi:hypothetical protein
MEKITGVDSIFRISEDKNEKICLMAKVGENKVAGINILRDNLIELRYTDGEIDIYNIKSEWCARLIKK